MKRILVVLFAAAAVLGASTTSITDTVRMANGDTASGTITLSWPTYTASTGEQILKGTSTVTVLGGAFTATLYPTPAGVYITANWTLAISTSPSSSRKTSSLEYWVVPTTISGEVYTLAQVRRASPVINVALRQIDGTGDSTGDLMVFCSGSWYKLPVGSNNTFLTPDSGQTCGVKWTSAAYNEKLWFKAALCNNATAITYWDIPTSTPAVAACVTGSNIQKGVLQYADTAGGFSAQVSTILPSDFTGALDARIIWRTAATTGNIKWSLSTACTAVAATATDDPAFNTASTATTAAPGTTLRIQTSSLTSVTATGCTAGSLLHLKLFRDGNDAADTIAASADLLGLELTLRRAM